MKNMGLLILAVPIALLAIFGRGLNNAVYNDEYERELKHSSNCPHCNRLIYNGYMNIHMQLFHPEYATYQTFTEYNFTNYNPDTAVMTSPDPNDIASYLESIPSINLLEKETFFLSLTGQVWSYRFDTPSICKNPNIVLVSSSLSSGNSVLKFKVNGGGVTTLIITSPTRELVVKPTVNGAPLIC
jgi:hypothetical protein